MDCDVDFEEPWSQWLDGVLNALPELHLGDHAPPKPETMQGAQSGQLIASPVQAELAEQQEKEENAQEVGLESIRMVTGAHKIPGPAGTRKNPAIAQILENVNLNHPQSDKETRHIALGINPGEIDYEVGDILGVFPRNCPDLVRRILQALDIPRQTPVLFDNEWFSIRDILIYRRDVMTIDRRLLTLAMAHQRFMF